MRFSLVPVSNAKEIVGTMVGMAVLDGDPDGLCKGDGRVEMESVDRPARAHAEPAHHRVPKEHVPHTDGLGRHDRKTLTHALDGGS